MSYTEPNEMSTKYKVVTCYAYELEDKLNEYSYTSWMLHSVAYNGHIANIIFTDIAYF